MVVNVLRDRCGARATDVRYVLLDVTRGMQESEPMGQMRYRTGYEPMEVSKMSIDIGLTAD